MPSTRNPGPPETARAPMPHAATPKAAPQTAAPRTAAASAPPALGGGAAAPSSRPPAASPAEAPAALPHLGQPCPGLAECPERPRLVRRLYDAAEREIAAVEACIGGRSAAAARRLGALATTLDRLVALDRKALSGQGGEVPAKAGRPQAGKAPLGDAHAPAVSAPVDAEAWAEALAAQLDPDKS